jgi:hypothetical protein
MALRAAAPGPQGLKPSVYEALGGPAEAGPYPKPICETGSMYLSASCVDPFGKLRAGSSRQRAPLRMTKPWTIAKNETALTFDYFPKITVLEKWELAAM